MPFQLQSEPSLYRLTQILSRTEAAGHKSASGDEHGVTVYFRDVTERIETERRLSESESQFRVMADSAPVLIWTTDADGRCNWLNESWLQFTGRTMTEELGPGWIEGIHPDDLEDCLKQQAKSLVSHAPFTME